MQTARKRVADYNPAVSGIRHFHRRNPLLLEQALRRARHGLVRHWPYAMGLGSIVLFRVLVTTGAWSRTALEFLQQHVQQIGFIAFAVLFVDTAMYCGRRLEAWRRGWLACTPGFDRNCRRALVYGLSSRTVFRLILLWGFVLALYDGGQFFWPTARTPLTVLSMVLIAGNLGYWARFKSGADRTNAVLRVSVLTAKLPGRLWVWQLSTVLTAWRTPRAAWWFGALIAGVPAGLSPAASLLALVLLLVLGAFLAAWQHSLGLVPRARRWLAAVRDGRWIVWQMWLPSVVLASGLAFVAATVHLLGMDGTSSVSLLAALLALALVEALLVLRTR